MKKLLFAFGAMALVCLSSCKKEDENDDDDDVVVETTVAQDKASIAAAQNAMISCVKALHDGKGVQAMVDFFNLTNGDALDTAFVKQMLDSLPNVLPEGVMSEEEGFEFDSAAGTYSYSNTTKQWTYANTPTDKIIVNFPSSKSQVSNDAKFTATKFETIQLIDGVDTTMMPKSGAVTLALNGSKTLELNLVNIDYAKAGDSYIPVAIEANAYIDPYLITLKETRVGTTTFKVEFDMSNSGSCAYSVDAQVDLAHDDYANIADEDVTLVKGTFGFEDFQVDANVKVSEIAALGEDPSVADVNSKFTAVVNYDGKKIGDLKLFEVAPDSVRLYIYYKDNTYDDVEAVYGDDFKDDMEGVWTDITGPWEKEEEQPMMKQ
ncbi:MAG: hypothetical protein ACKOXB_01505 [Flavobacteriales bacterium]